MLLSQSPVRAAATFCVALMTSVTLFTASTAEARGTAVAYTAELQAPVSAAQEIIRDTVFYCNGTECKAAKSTSSARTICAKVVDEFGPVTSFTYKGKAFDEAQLAKCNN